MKHNVSFRVNGEPCECLVEPRDSLLDILRDKFYLTGTKKGCNNGDCGACTVIMDGRPVNSCLVLAVEAEGKDVLTIEGVSHNAEFYPIQEAFIKHGAVQCGYCTPGMIMSAKALLEENSSPTAEEIQMAISGNLCRCTGYVKIVEAIEAARDKMREGGKLNKRV